MKILLSLGIVLLLVLSGCGGVSQIEAERTSRSFIESNVKFYGVSSNGSQEVFEHDLELLASQTTSTGWQVTYKATAMISNISKEKNITVCINQKGEAIGFNAKNMPCA